MDTIGLDLHKRESQLCILTDDGEFLERRIVTGRAAFASTLGNRRVPRILLEASTEESEWVARYLAQDAMESDTRRKRAAPSLIFPCRAHAHPLSARRDRG